MGWEPLGRKSAMEAGGRKQHYWSVLEQNEISNTIGIYAGFEMKDYRITLRAAASGRRRSFITG